MSGDSSVNPNSVVGQIGQTFSPGSNTTASDILAPGRNIGQGSASNPTWDPTYNLWNDIKPKSDMPDTKVAGAPPDPNKVMQDNLNNQLQQELTLRSQRTAFVGTGGLLDSQPTTASRVLLGS
jgi:hypothetical protein